MCHSSASNNPDTVVPMAEPSAEPILLLEALATYNSIFLRLSEKLDRHRKFGSSAGKGMPMPIQISR